MSDVARAGKGCRKVFLVLALFVVVPIAISVVSAVFVAVDDDADDTEPSVPVPSQSVDSGSGLAPVSVPGQSVAPLPVGATSVRFEVHGTGRTPDISTYRDGTSTRARNRSLPWAVEVPITAQSSYLSVSATDYGATDDAPMQCRAYVGDVLVSLNTGIERVECTLTSASFPRATDD